MFYRLVLLMLILAASNGLEVSSSSFHHTVDHTVAAPIDGQKIKRKGNHDSQASAPDRGVPLPISMDPEDLYDIYRKVYEQYTENALKSTDWKILYDKDNITISMLPNEADRDCPYVKMELYIPAMAKTCWDFLDVRFWDLNMPKMDAFYEGSTIHSEYNVPSNNATIYLCRKCLKRLFAFGKRDMVFLSINDVPQNDTLISGTVSVITNDLPREKGYIRAYQDSISFYKPVPRFSNDRNNTATYVLEYRRLVN